MSYQHSRSKSFGTLMNKMLMQWWTSNSKACELPSWFFTSCCNCIITQVWIRPWTKAPRMCSLLNASKHCHLTQQTESSSKYQWFVFVPSPVCQSIAVHKQFSKVFMASVREWVRRKRSNAEAEEPPAKRQMRVDEVQVDDKPEESGTSILADIMGDLANQQTQQEQQQWSNEKGQEKNIHGWFQWTVFSHHLWMLF